MFCVTFWEYEKINKLTMLGWEILKIDWLTGRAKTLIGEITMP